MGTEGSEENLKVMERFVEGVRRDGGEGEVRWALERYGGKVKGRGKEEKERWVGMFSLKELKPSINYELLDKRYLRMYKHNVTMEDIKERNIYNEKYNNREEDDETDEEIGFDTKKEGQAYFFNLIKPPS